MLGSNLSADVGGRTVAGAGTRSLPHHRTGATAYDLGKTRKSITATFAAPLFAGDHRGMRPQWASQARQLTARKQREIGFAATNWRTTSAQQGQGQLRLHLLMRSRMILDPEHP